MIDDLHEGSSQTQRFNLSRNVDDILKYKSDRRHAARWARNPRFLTYDDTHDAEQASRDGPINQQCNRCVLRNAPVAGHICAGHFQNGMPLKDLRALDREAAQFNDPCVHVTKWKCPACEDIPLFPKDPTQIKRFRIRRLQPKGIAQSKLPPCADFLAVSYCWSSQTETSSNETIYEVIEEDGTIRKMRAPKVVIDRAVDFASYNGIRMIWIDQVSLINFRKPAQNSLTKR